MLQNVCCVHVDVLQGAIPLPAGSTAFSAPPSFPGQRGWSRAASPTCALTSILMRNLLGRALALPTQNLWSGPLPEEQQGEHPAAEGPWGQEHHIQGAASPRHHLHRICAQGAILLFLFFPAMDICAPDTPGCTTGPSVLALHM